MEYMQGINESELTVPGFLPLARIGEAFVTSMCLAALIEWEYLSLRTLFPSLLILSHLNTLGGLLALR